MILFFFLFLFLFISFVLNVLDFIFDLGLKDKGIFKK